MRRHRLLVPAALIACSSGESSSANPGVRIDSLPGGIPQTVSSSPVDSGRWQLIVARDIQPPESDSAELANPRDITLADDGTVFVSDANPTAVKVFDRTAQLVRKIGREGEGPGEFRNPYITVAGDTLVAHDPRVGRATSFNWRTGAVLTERRTACCYFSPIGVDGSGRAVVRMLTQPDSTLPNAQNFVRFPVNGTNADTVRIPAGTQKAVTPTWTVREGNQVFMSLLVPFQPRAFHVVDRSAGFVTAFSSDYRLIRTTTGRDTVAVFGREYSPVPIPASEKSAIVEKRVEEIFTENSGRASKSSLRASFEQALIPDQRPAFEGVWVDHHGRTWVQVGSADSTMVQLDLFDQQGRWLDAIRVPASSWPKSPWSPISFAKDEVAVAIEGEDGRPLVRVFRVERR